MPDGSVFQTFEAGSLPAGEFSKLLCRTAREKGRIEITNGDGTSCVMISKAELDALEEALEILSNNDGRVLHEQIQHMLAGAERPVVPPA